MLRTLIFNGRMARIHRDRSATAAVEFAILSPILILVLLGMVAYGIYFGASHSIQQLAADAARTAIAGLSASERETLVTDYIDRNAGKYPFVDPDKLVVEANDSTDDGSKFVVSLSYDASSLPIWGLFNGLVMPDTTIERASTIRIGGL
jgi:Flp pilus assembly protein TadG